MIGACIFWYTTDLDFVSYPDKIPKALSSIWQEGEGKMNQATIILDLKTIL